MGVQAGVLHWESLIPGVSLTFRVATFREETLGPEDCPSVRFPVSVGEIIHWLDSKVWG